MAELPVEIISIVVENFAGAGIEDQYQDSNSLFSCMLVNKTWFHESARVLWRANPDLEMLERHVQDQHRKKLYAGFFEKVYLEYDSDFLEQVMDGWCDFGKLKELRIGCDVLSYSVVDKFLVPTLENVAIHVGTIDDAVLDKFMARCPLIKEFVVKDNPDLFPVDPDSRDVVFVPSPDKFGEFIETVPLRKFSADLNDMLRCMSEQRPIIALLTKHTLENIDLPSFTAPQIESALAAINNEANVLPNLKKLYCRAKDGFIKLVPCLKRVESLKLMMAADSPGMLNAIGTHCHNLRDFHVRYPSRRQLSCRFKELPALSRGCPLLQCFKLTSHDPYASFNDSLFGSFAQNAPNLHKLDLAIPLDPDRFTYKSVEKLGLSCRHLTYFNYKFVPSGRVDFEHSRIKTHGKVLFPRLERMEPLPRSADRSSCFTHFAATHMPRLVKNQKFCDHALCEVHRPDAMHSDEERETERAIRQAVTAVVGLHHI